MPEALQADSPPCAPTPSAMPEAEHVDRAGALAELAEAVAYRF